MLLCCAAGSTVKTFEVTLESIIPQRTFNSHNADITSVQYNHNGRILASSSVNGRICLHVPSSGEKLSELFYPTDAPDQQQVNALQFSSGSRFLASGGDNGFLWDLKTQEIMQTYNISSSAITSVAFGGYKDECIVGGTASGAIYICDVQTAEIVRSLTVDPTHGMHQVMAIQTSPHPMARHVLGSTYMDGSVRVWNLATGQLTAEFVRQHEAPATSLTLSSVSKVLLASGGFDGRVIFYDTVQRKNLRSLDLEQPISSLALCADGKTFAVGTTTGEIHLYDLRGAISPLFSTLVHETFAVQSLHFSPLASDVNVGSIPAKNIPAESAHHTSTAETINNGDVVTKLKKIDRLTSKSHVSYELSSSPTLDSTRLVTRTMEPSGIVPPRTQSKRLLTPATQNPPQPILNMSSKTSTTHASTDEIGLFSSPTYRQTLKPAEHAKNDVDAMTCSSQQADLTNLSMRAEIQHLREEINLRHQKDIEQLSTMFETLMDQYDAVVEENRSLRQENEWLKAHISAS
ncbi:putative WD40/YVTN repeat-like-containing domain superfamily, WD40-repeat-containing [Plasmopara halstedii]